MARNSEKAQSMLYRFREQQAVEMGMGNRVKGERRPRMASSVSSLRDCERYRGDILREISRKVGKIQDESLTDYQIRDLNDEINQLMREKRHFETQIVSLGGANYKRGQQAMTDDDGKEVPGTRGYKYFGRAKDLPGVREMFNKGSQAATEESARNASFQMYRNQGTDYYGDNDEMDPELAEEEDEAARKDWEHMVAESANTLGLDSTSSFPSYPSTSKLPPPIPLSTARNGNTKMGESSSSSKRKATEEPDQEEVEKSSDDKAEPESTEDSSMKKAKTESNGKTSGSSSAVAVTTVDPAVASQAALAVAFLSVLDPESLKNPVLPSVEEMGKVLLDVRKKALREEYGV